MRSPSIHWQHKGTGILGCCLHGEFSYASETSLATDAVPINLSWDNLRKMIDGIRWSRSGKLPSTKGKDVAICHVTAKWHTCLTPMFWCIRKKQTKKILLFLRDEVRCDKRLILLLKPAPNLADIYSCVFIYRSLYLYFWQIELAKQKLPLLFTWKEVDLPNKASSLSYLIVKSPASCRSGIGMLVACRFGRRGGEGAGRIHSAW